MQVEFVLLILSILFFASILAGKAGSRFGVPALPAKMLAKNRIDRISKTNSICMSPYSFGFNSFKTLRNASASAPL